MSAEPPAPLDRRALLRRMAIGGAAVWATPMMQSVASAQAAASCGPGILNWDTFTTGSSFTNTIIGNTTITLAISGVTPRTRSRPTTAGSSTSTPGASPARASGSR